MLLKTLSLQESFSEVYMGNPGLEATLRRQENGFDRTQNCFCASDCFVNKYESSIAQADAILLIVI